VGGDGLSQMLGHSNAAFQEGISSDPERPGRNTASTFCLPIGATAWSRIRTTPAAPGIDLKGGEWPQSIKRPARPTRSVFPTSSGSPATWAAKSTGGGGKEQG